MPPPKSKKKLESFMGILNYPHIFSPVTLEICAPLQKLTAVNADWTWKSMYQDVYDRAKKIVKKDACMTFYDASRPLYMETDISHVGLGARLLQVKDDMNCGHDKVPHNATLHQIAFASIMLCKVVWGQVSFISCCILR